MFNISDTFNSIVDSTLNGISDFFTAKSQSILKGFTRTYTLSPNQKMTFLNDLFVDRCYGVTEDYTSSAPLHNLDDGSIVAETIINEPNSFNLSCKFTSQDHAEKFKKLLKYRESKKLITVMYGGNVYENLAILNISKNVTNIHYTEFAISLRKLTFVKVMTIPAPETKKIVSKPTSSVAGKENTDKILSTSKTNVAATYGHGEARKPLKEFDVINVVSPFPFGIEGNILEKKYGIDSIIGGGI
ncbi:MAG: hypothetical protein RSB50_06340 [Cetobacterium sp.]